MQPTTLKIPPELKERVASLAADEGKTVHAFLLEAIEEQTGRAERRREFVAAALASEEKALKSGKGYRAEAVHAWLWELGAGKSPKSPKKVAWRR